MGIVELLALLMTLAGFGVDENPNAPSAKEVMSHAPARADYMVHVDLVGIVPNNYQILADLPDHPSLEKQPEARKALEQIIGQAEMMRGMVKGAIGLDPVTDITSLTVWLNVPDAGNPNMLMVVRGNIPKDIVDKIASAASLQTTTIHGKPTLSPDPAILVGSSDGGDLLVGSPAWVKPRLKKRFRRRGSSALIRGASKMLDNKPAMLFASGPSRRWVRRVNSELENDEEAALLADLATGHRFLGISIKHNGVEWTAISRTKSGHARAVRASQGALDLMRAMHHGARGLARVVLAGVPSYAGMNDVAEGIADHADELMKLVEATTGDGRFQADIDDDARRRTIHVDATGEELSDVLPAAGFLPIFGGAATWLLVGSGPASMSKPATATPMP